jgi:hypothetical protein
MNSPEDYSAADHPFAADEGHPTPSQRDMGRGSQKSPSVRRGHAVLVDREAHEANKALLRKFSKSLLPALGIILALVTMFSLFAMMIIMFNADPSTGRHILAIHLVQISLGIFLGMTCLFLGAAMSWFGITGTYTIGAEGGGTKLNVQGTSVGIILLVGGIVLTGLTLQKSATSYYELPRSTNNDILLDYMSKKEKEFEARLDAVIAKGQADQTVAIQSLVSDKATIQSQLKSADERAKTAAARAEAADKKSAEMKALADAAAKKLAEQSKSGSERPISGFLKTQRER